MLNKIKLKFYAGNFFQKNFFDVLFKTLKNKKIFWS